MADNHITQKLPQSIPYPSDQQVNPVDMIWVWNSDVGQLQRANVSQLPFGSGTGGGTTTMLGSPFILDINSEQVSIVGGDTVISDTRLLDKDNYPIYTTQLNVAFRTDEVIYDKIGGKVTIKDFVLLGGEEITITPQGIQSGGTGGSLQPLWDEINALKAMLSPFLPSTTGASHGRVWWTGGRDKIPQGWQEDTSSAGYTPRHAPIAGSPGDKIGNDTHTLTSNQLGSFSVSGTNDRTGGTSRNNGWWRFTFSGGGENATLNNGDGSNVNVGPVKVKLDSASEGFSLVQKTMYGIWIKYVG